MNHARIAALAFASVALCVGAISHAIPTNATSTASKTVPAKIAMVTGVNGNNASTRELETLPGVGPKVAAQIIKNRPYKNVQDFQTRVKGIGPKTWRLMKKHIVFK